MALSIAVFCAFNSRRFSRIASTEPAREETVVIRRIKVSSTPCVNVHAVSAVSATGVFMRKRLRNS